jgi:hypothetical protein
MDVNKRFASVTDEEVMRALKENVPENTLNAEKHALKLFNNFIDENAIAHPVRLSEYNSVPMKFILAARKQDGQEYKATSLYAICTGLFRHLKKTYGFDVWNDGAFNHTVELLRRMKPIKLIVFYDTWWYSPEMPPSNGVNFRKFRLVP